jgi:predicted dehydrogenase
METRFGVVGTAHWARTVHCVGIVAAPGVRLVGIWGRDPDKTRSLAELRSTRAFAAFDDMLADVDAVSFAVPPAVQHVLALRAIAAGKHVLLEKPIATSHRDAAELAAAVARAGVASIVFFTRRFVPEIAAAIDRNAQRPWRSAEVAVHSAALAAGSPYEHSLWRQASNGALWDIGPHVLSVLIAMLGPVTDARRLPSQGHAARFETRHQRGAVATASVSLRESPQNAASSYRFIDASGEFLLPEPAPELERAAIFARAVSAFGDAIRSGARAHSCDVRLGVETVRLLEQIDRDGGLAAHDMPPTRRTT